MFSFLFSFLGSQAQSINYCIPGRFAENDFYSPLAIVSTYDLVYGNNNDYQGINQDLKLDIHYPNLSVDPLSKRPLVLIIHGGSYYSGSKSDFTAYALQLARRGYVAVTVQYRLGWDYIGTGLPCGGNINGFRYAAYRSLQDVKACLRYLAFHAGNYGIDTDRFFLMGQSAGAFTAMHCAFMQQQEADLVFPAAHADLGPIDSVSNNLYANYQLSGVFNWCGGILDTNAIDANEQIPVLSIHGLLDNVVPLDTGAFLGCNGVSNPYPFVYGPKAIQRRMKNIGHCSVNNFDADGMHCVYPSLEPVVYIPSKFTCFFKGLLCGNCVTEEKIGYSSPSCMDAAPNNMETQTTDESWAVYPNPSSDYLIIRFAPYHTGMLNIKMTDAQGISHFSQANWNPVFQKEMKIPVSSMKAGIYYLQVQSKDGLGVQKVIIQ